MPSKGKKKRDSIPTDGASNAFVHEDEDSAKKPLYTDENRQPLGDVPRCPVCESSFGIFRKKYYCLACYKVYCSDCAPYSPSHSGDRRCENCIHEEHEAKSRETERILEEKRLEEERLALLRKIEKAMEACENREQTLRGQVEEPRDEQIEKLQHIFDKKLGKMKAAQEAEAAKQANAVDHEKRGQIIDKWRAVKGPRSGSLTLTVARAQRLVPPKLMLSTNSAVMVKGERVDFESDTIRQDVDPEYQFETYFAVEDDTLPISLYVRDWTLGYAHQIAEAHLYLHKDYEKLVREVTDEEVYVEKGHLVLDCYKHGELLPNTNITVHWSFELREVHATAMCEECGRIESRCSCPEELKEEQRQKKAKALEDKLRAEQEEQQKRHEEEYQKRLEEEERRRLAAEKVFNRGYADMEVEREGKILEINSTERREWETIEKGHREGYHKARMAEEKRKRDEAQLKLCVAQLDKNDNIVRKSYFQILTSWVAMDKAEKDKAIADRKAQEETTQRRTEDNKAQTQFDKKEKAHEKENRNQDYQDEKAELSAGMVNDDPMMKNRPRPEVYHDDQKEREAQKKESGGCCIVM